MDLAGCFYLLPVVFLRYITPHSLRIEQKSHSALVILLLTSAADIVDFADYAKNPSIVNELNNFNSILGNIYYLFKSLCLFSK
jgi:hypothetical protein